MAADGRRERVLIVGSGFVARHIAEALAADGVEGVLSSRRRPVAHVSGRPAATSATWVRLDARDREGCVAVCSEVKPAAVVLAHGPSSIDWCAAHPKVAFEIHYGIAENVLRATRAWIMVVSTDNVFAGDAEAYSEIDSPSPANPYGVAKLAVEDLVTRIGNNLAWRVSLIYGWRLAGERDNFFHRTVRALEAGESVAAPVDQWTTPVVAEDVAAWASRLVTVRPSGVLHLGGPQRVDRFTWAHQIAAEFGLPAEGIVGVPRSTTPYGVRPRNSCLRSIRSSSLVSLRGLRTRGTVEGATDLRAGRSLSLRETTGARVASAARQVGGPSSGS
jgi:5-epi-valiolone dehydratase